MFRTKLFLFFALLFAGSFFVCQLVFAATGNTTGYAWSDNIGWIKFGCADCNTQITSSAFTGYAWNDSYGWIKLDVSTSGVKNNSSGVLSGHAWGDNLGWIDFAGVTISSSGKLTGTATGDAQSDIVGTVNFDCTNCDVTTTWRQVITTAGGGGGLPAAAYSKPVAPNGGFSFLINNGDRYTASTEVMLELTGGPDTKRMAISNFADFKGAVQEDYMTQKEWTLSQGNGPKTVYVKFFNQYGQPSQVISYNIVLNSTATQNNNKVIPLPVQEKAPNKATGASTGNILEQIEDLETKIKVNQISPSLLKAKTYFHKILDAGKNTIIQAGRKISAFFNFFWRPLIKYLGF